MDVLRLAETGFEPLESLLAPFGLDVCRVPDDEAIPGSHWGEEEAGLIKHCLYARYDTPVHSALHEACHWLLMSEQRRQKLHTCLLYTSPSPRDRQKSRMPSSA